jgi:hypothetical protein
LRVVQQDIRIEDVMFRRGVQRIRFSMCHEMAAERGC